MKQIYRELLDQINVRQNLSALRKWLRDGGQPEELKALLEGQEDVFFRFLESEDAKSRKNAALLFGDLCYEPAVLRLYQAYQDERTLFVRSAYPEALANYPSESIRSRIAPSDLHRREQLLADALLNDMLEGEPIGENRKHIEEELRTLRQLLIRCEGIKHHRFAAPQGEHRVLLVTNRMHREVVRRLAENAVCDTAETVGEPAQIRLHPMGVSVQTQNLAPLLLLRAYRELLFLNPNAGESLVSDHPKDAAAQLVPWLLTLCERYHEGSRRYYFRVECRGTMSLEERGNYTKRLGAALELQSAGALINSPGDYEVELRLIMTRKGMFFACVKFMTLPDHRFDYRKNAISASIHPSTAALIMELVKPYLKEGAQLLDPFCGVGTMLIERDYAVPAKDKYGTDIFRDAIEYGRENALLAGRTIHFIHRDFSDFRHEYPFDEIITNMPTRGKKTKEEIERLYSMLFVRAAELLKPGAVMIMYTNEIGFVKKQLRLHRGYKLLQETAMQEKSDFYLLVIGWMG